MLGLKSGKAVLYHVKRNKFPNAFMINNNWRIPISDFENYSSKTKDCLNTSQAAERLGYKNKYSVLLLIENSTTLNAFKANGSWWIPISDIEKLNRKV
ncbi:hypothetical protein [Sporosarcina ureae]|uniref:hypothetical protein n=1 Tax=Sporosarcina ureae TaxID=1571 RepID=UPI000A17D145|nr:hypothetical protein [Sporosarcina ureae]ARK21857.1 hypothetical protein SporoP32a_10180 [Sporosarcina ureae]